MSAVIGTLRADLTASIADFASGFSKAADQVKSFSDKFDKAGKSMQDFGGKMTLWLTAPLAVVGGSMIKTAMAAEEMMSAFDVSFGDMADATRDWAETTGDAMGRSTYELQEAATAFNGLFKAGGPATEQAKEMSKTFTVLAQDLASFHDMSPEDTLQALRSGLSGEAEPLRRFNVYLTEGAIKAEAYSSGIAKAGAELTEQQKIQARANLILKNTSEAQGDVLRTSDSATNTVQGLRSAWNELSVTLGTKLLPIFTPIVAGVTRIVEGFGNLSPAMQTTILVVGGIAAALGPMIVGLGMVVSAIGTLLPLVTGIAGALGIGMAGGLGAVMVSLAPFVLAIGAAVAVFVVFREQIMAFLSGAWAGLQSALGPALSALGAEVRNTLAQIGAYFSALSKGPVGQAVRAFMSLMTDVQAVMGRVWGEVIGRLLAGAVEVVRGFVRQIGNLFALVSALIRGDFKGAWEAAKRILTNSMETMLNVLDRFFPGAKDAILGTVNAVRGWFADTLGPLFEWVGKKAWDVTEEWRGAFGGAVEFARTLYNGVRQIIADRLGPLINWAVDRIKDLRRAFGELANDARKAPGAAAAAPAAPAAAPTAPRTPAAPAAPAAPAGGAGKKDTEAAKAARDYASALADLKEKLDPVSAALAAYNEALSVARRGGVDMNHATNLLAREAVEAAGGWDVLKTRLNELPPAVAAAARAMRMEDIKDAVQGIADMADPMAAAVREYTEQVALAVEGGLDLARVEPVLASAAFEAAGGLDVWRNSLDQLPPALRAAADAALAAEASEYREDLVKTGRALEETYDAQLAYNTEVAKLRELLDAGAISQGTFAKAMEDAGKSYQDHLAATNPAIRARFDAIDSISGALEDVATGTKTWQDAWQELMKELFKIMVIQPMIDRLRQSMRNFATPDAGGGGGGTGGGGGGFNLGTIVKGIGSLFGGFRKDGGPVVPGRVYMVGEEGPEPFIPKTSGTILPHGTLGDGGPVQPSITVYAPDALTSQWIKGAIQDAYNAAVRDGASAGAQIARQIIPEEMSRNQASSFI